ncbi:glutamate--cysteine ligase [Streptomyces sp. CB02959]|uniref:carboxylate-amine ligase n=1 Tax=Streptomyces sp. CB02959 TaxID=2020330 RepID=UPI000C27D572|nr:glutamate--cysteine ligase [Streptomyces sp. CB02959]PJN38440.1 glutamate--cysteine ligase [Streptomyces sp. CB02959]
MSSDERIPTVGVEEEYFLVDPETREVVPAGSRVLRRAETTLADQVSGELTEYQIEAKTPPCAGLGELRGHLDRMRTAVAEAAAAEGLRMAATGTPVLSAGGPAPLRDDPAYGPGLAAYRGLNENHTHCALHTHVEVPDLDHAVLVCNHLRPWLPVLVALSANSPFRDGRDTGYASWRTAAGGQWPVAGPPPYFRSADHYKQLCATLEDAGAVVGGHTLLWDVRPSAHLPTVEIRAMDVPVGVEQAAVLAVLVRALVVQALEQVRRGEPGPDVCPALLRAAYWRAARDGCTDHALDVHNGRPVPAGHLLRDLFAYVRPALEEAGELAAVTEAVTRLAGGEGGDGDGERAGGGGGAQRQRAAFARRGDARDVVDELIRHTAPAHALHAAH